MKEKVKNILKQYEIPTHLHGTIVFVIDKLNEEEIDKRVAFEVACNPDLLEAETNYKLYEGEIKQLKEIIQAQDELCKMAFDKNYPWNVSRQIQLQEMVEELKKGAGL